MIYMSKRKICVVITARPSYSRIKSTLHAINNHKKLDLFLVVAASALLDRYGSAVNYIEDDGFKISAKVFNVLEGENLTAAAKTTGIGILELSSVFETLKPDIVLTIADRFETIATAIAASFMNIPLGHIQGGEVTGNIDEKVRHSITKLSDYHFVSSQDAYKRVINLGENPDYVFKTGCPSIDIALNVKNNPQMNFNPYLKYGGVGNKPKLDNGYIVVMQHPVTNEYDQSRQQIEQTINALKLVDIPILWFWPNIDAGADGVSGEIRTFRESENTENFHFFKNMKGDDFLKLLVNSKCLIGNSSVGIRECSFLGVPVVNIGTRQNKRERGKNVIDVNNDSTKIFDAIDKILKGNFSVESSNIYGNGNSGNNIAKILAEVPLLFHKTIMY